MSATSRVDPPRIVFCWPADGQATSYTVYRKGRDEATWGKSIAVLPGPATGYTDSNVVAGGRYEYRFRKSASAFYGEGYIYAGIHAPLDESRGKVVLVVDQSMATSLSNELARLEQDLVGDGWSLVRHDVARTVVEASETNTNLWITRSNEVAHIKALVKADYDADSNAVRCVFLFGHVPIPYSGRIAPDGHPDHIGAWPADVFYADMAGSWTDSFYDATLATDARNWNQRGDGKLDRDYLSNKVVLQVGRVDMANLPAFSLSETELLRQYLDKDHRFRHKAFTVQDRGLVDDELGVSEAGAPVAVNGWRNFAPFFGSSNILANSDWLGAVSASSFLWSYACGAGSYTSIGGVGSTADLANNDPQVVFTMLFGSYFGDWDSPDNFMRAVLGTPHYTLASAWVGRPYWQFHHMAMGETIGFSTRLSQNNGSLYDANTESQGIHIALMGDPTLRMHIVAPPSGLKAIANCSGGVDLTWCPSGDPVLGYHIYRAPTALGPFTRLNSELVASTNYADPVNASNIYMVRAVALEVRGSGSYYNASQGIFQGYAPAADPGASPHLTLSALSSSSFLLRGRGMPDCAYRIECSASLEGPWQCLGSSSAANDGVFVYLDESPSPRRFYRSFSP